MNNFFNFKNFSKIIIIKIINFKYFQRKNKIILTKENKFDIASISFSPYHFKFSSKEQRDKFIVELKKFIEILNNKVKYANLSVFQKNFSNYFFEIQEKKNLFTHCFVSTAIKYRNNKFFINDLKSMAHELFHLASAIKFGQTGFKQADYNGGFIGQGLNEGYTQLLTEKYFPENDKSYPIETYIAHILDFLIGSEIMEKSYFNADLENIINELKKFNSLQNIYKFLYSLDLLSEICQAEIYPKEYALLSICYSEVIQFLYDCFITKLEIEHDLEQSAILEIKDMFYNKFVISCADGEKREIDSIDFHRLEIFDKYLIRENTDIKKEK